jgi:hypothetical protein
MKLRSWGLIAGIAVSGVMAGGSFDRVGAVTTVLYDGNSGVTPNLYGPYLNFRTIGGSSQIASGGVTTLNTFDPNPLLSESTFAGYGNRSNAGTLLTSTLDNNAGYTLSFKIKINSQTNTGINGPNRAGFSVLVLGSDKKGVEIGFRDSDIFAQNNTFSAIDPLQQKSNISGILSTLTTYDLKVNSAGYTLTIGSNPNQSFSGLLKDYTAAATTALTQVYNTSDVIFFGDNTTSAGASVDIQNITLNTNAAAVPEPSSLLGMGLAIGFGATLKRKLGKTDRSITKLLK